MSAPQPSAPAKRPLTSEDDNGNGKKQKEPTYETYDECFDGGVEMEEKGERYKDGEKVSSLAFVPLADQSRL